MTDTRQVLEEAREALDIASQELRAAAPSFDPVSSSDMWRAEADCRRVVHLIQAALRAQEAGDGAA